MINLNQILLNFKLSDWVFSHLTINLLFLVFGWIFLTVGLIFLICLFIKWCLIKKLHRQPQTILEVKPLRVTEQNPYTTEQLFNLIHGLAKQSTWVYRFFNVSKSYALEIVSTKEDGIRYLMRINQNDSDLIEKSLLSYLPGLSITKVNDYLPKDLDQFSYKTTEFKLANHFAFPLKKQETLDKHDPIAYMTGNMTKLSEDELISFQLIIAPLNKRLVPDIKRISKLIYSCGDLVVDINNKQSKYPFWIVFRYLFILGLQILLLPVGILIFIASNGKEGPFLAWNLIKPSKKTDNPYQQELEKLVKAKLDQPLFNTSIRLLVISSDSKRLYQKGRGFVSALSSFSNSGYQAIVTTFNFRLKLIKNLNNIYLPNVFLNRLVI